MFTNFCTQAQKLRQTRQFNQFQRGNNKFQRKLNISNSRPHQPKISRQHPPENSRQHPHNNLHQHEKQHEKQHEHHQEVKLLGLNGPIPKNHELLSMPRYIEKLNYVRQLVQAEQYNASIVYALDAFSEYRMVIVTWLYEIKKENLEKCKTSKKAPTLALATVVFRVLNNAQRSLLNIHEKTIKNFEDNAHKLFNNSEMRKSNPRLQVKKILDLLLNNLQQYEKTVLHTRNILGQGLSFF